MHLSNHELIEKNFRTYIRNRPAFLAVLRSKEASLYAPNLPFSSPVLDIGCGDGFFAQVVLSQKTSTPVPVIDIGLDLKSSRIKEATVRGTYQKTVIYDGKHMPFADRTFNTIISNSVLEHIPNISEVLKEAYRVLKPNGTMLVTVIAKPWAEYYFGNKICGNWYSSWMTKKQLHVNLYTHIEWDRKFKTQGFSVIRKIGHAIPSVSTWTDIFHYLGLPNLLTYLLFKKWVLFPSLAEKLMPIKYFQSLITPNSSYDSSVALFYELRKT